MKNCAAVQYILKNCKETRNSSEIELIGYQNEAKFSSYLEAQNGPFKI